MPIDQHLQVFMTVVEKESFSRAAEAHHMTQPAVSQYIHTLERQVGTRLLERTNKYVRLNKAGQIVYHYGQQILGMYEQMQRHVDDLTRKASGSLSIGASYTFGEYVLPHLIAKVQKMYPDIDPTIRIGNTAQIANLVESHQLDIGIVEGNFKNKTLIQEVFAEDSMVVVAAPTHPIALKNDMTTSELAAQTWIVREAGSGTREATEEIFKSLNISPKKLLHYSSIQPIKASVEVGLGISLLSKWAIQKELKHGDLVVVELDALQFTRSFSFLKQSPFETKALEVFIEILRDQTK